MRKDLIAMDKILIIIDMQNFFITGRLGTSESHAIVPAVVDKIKGFEGLVYVTQDINPHCEEGSFGFDIHPQIKAVLPANTVYITKRTFGSVDLVQTISSKYADAGASDGSAGSAGGGASDGNAGSAGGGASGSSADSGGSALPEIEFCGVCTHVCVISNALMMRAFLPKAKIAVDASCCAGLSPELHQAGLDVMRSCRIEVR